MTGKDQRKLFYWDSCMFFYALKGHSDSAVSEGIDKLLKQLDVAEIVICSSVLVHIECSAERIKRFPAKYGFLQGIYQKIELIQVDSRVIKLAAEIKDFYAPKGNTISTPDAIHLASAIHYGTDEFHTADGTAKDSRGKLLTLVNPIAGKYHLNIKVPRADQPTLFKNSGKGISQTTSSK